MGISVLLVVPDKERFSGFPLTEPKQDSSLQPDLYIGESCGVGDLAQVLRIATILYGGGHTPCWFF